MSRRKVRVRISTAISEQAASQLLEMLGSGYWGTSVSAIVRELLYRGLREEAVRTGKATP